jgi:phosphoribosylaminoimidazolecarboxamide formyltransferase/IMP cyclohydrolase
MSELKAVRRALLSVTDKTGLVEFAGVLAGLGVELVSTGGTAKALRDAGLAVRDVADLTGFPEMLDGRVKTLHPAVHGGLLHRRGDPKHVAAVVEHGIAPIDMVVVNLYAFEKTAARLGVGLEEMVENIDIGGPSMLRSAAKNFEDVAVVSDPAEYAAVAEELRANAGRLSRETRWRLARGAFATTAAYDSAIATTLEARVLAGPTSGPEASPVNGAPGSGERTEAPAMPPVLRVSARLKSSLRYG